jgi:hypothetical protein
MEQPHDVGHFDGCIGGITAAIHLHGVRAFDRLGYRFRGQHTKHDGHA